MSFLLPDEIKRPVAIVTSREFWVRFGVVMVGVVMVAFALSKVLAPYATGAVGKVQGMVTKVAGVVK